MFRTRSRAALRILSPRVRTEFLVHGGANKIGKITTGGTIAEFAIPTSGSGGISAGPDNNVWFVETYGSKIGKITAAGTIVEYSIPTAGAGAARIAAGPDANLWFADETGNRIGKITP